MSDFDMPLPDQELRDTRVLLEQTQTELSTALERIAVLEGQMLPEPTEEPHG